MTNAPATDLAREAFTALSPLNLEDWTALAECLRTRHVPAGGFLLQQGDICDYLGVLTRGALRTYNVDYDGTERTGWLTVAGMVSTEVLSFYSREPSLEVVEVVRDAELVFVSHADLEALCRSRPAIERLARRVSEHILTDLKGHLLSHIHDPAPERYARLVRLRPSFVEQVPLKHVASFLGIDPSTLSRIRTLEVARR
ncbi:Crp/Fnr family transcriptional regulator [Rubrivirga sp.]|uniref:Crp/Fnr family transcriptional regulator n=1 Tax=Rubrivirga sp. TaxID=1885344 RepID=UPI003C70ECBC